MWTFMELSISSLIQTHLLLHGHHRPTAHCPCPYLFPSYHHLTSPLPHLILTSPSPSPPSPHPHLTLTSPSHLPTSPSYLPHLSLTSPSPHLHIATSHAPPPLAHLHPAPIKGIHVIGAYNMVVEPESARRRADVLEGGSVILMAAPDQPEHKITLDFEKVVRLKTIKLQGRHQPVADYADSTCIVLCSHTARLIGCMYSMTTLTMIGAPCHYPL